MLWGVAGAREPEVALGLQLDSMVAFTHLSSRERLAALMSVDTHERLRWAEFALARKQRLLRAEAALYEACF